MTSKTKYIVIVLLLVVLATTSVGLSTWNIHYQANVGIIDFTATTPGTQESILNRYVYFEGAQEHTTVDENDNTVTSTKISYPIALDTTEEIFTYVYDGNTHSPTVFVPIEENSKGDENHPTDLFLDDGELNNAWGITDVFDEIKFKYEYRLIAMPFVAKDYKGNSDNYCEVHSVTYGVDTNDDNIGDSITVCISWKNGKKGNNQGKNVLVVIPLSATENDVQIIIGDQSYSLNDTTNTTANKISVSFDGNTASVGIKGFNSYSFSMENNGWTETAPSNAGVYQCRITAVVNSETDTSADTDEHKNAANEAIEVLNALTESDISYAAQVTYAILPYDVTMDNLTTDSFSYSQAAQSYALLSTVAETDSTDSTSGLTKINNNDNSFYVTYGGIGFEITITSNFTTLNGSTPTVSFPIGEYLFSDANALTALLTDNWSEEENHYYTTYGFSPDPNYQITNPVVHYTILRREVEIDSWTNTELTYNGTAQSQTASATNSYDAEFTYSYTDANGNALESTPVNAGTYTVWASVGSNYYLSCNLEGIKTQTNDADEVTKIGWEYTIAPKTVTITWGDTEFTYDGNSHAPTATVASSELCSQNGVLDTCTVTVTGAQTNASTTAYTATATLDNGNYTATNATQAFTINPKPITKPAENTSTFTYDGSTQTYTLATNSAYTISDNVQTNADEYTVTVSLNDTTNYVWADDSTADVIFTFTIAPASVTVVINNATITYGQDAPTYTYTATGLLGTDTLGATAVCSYTKGNNADTYEITLDQTNVNTNYNITSVTNGTLTVQKASVTVVINNATITYGQDAPTYTYTATGLLGTDTLGATAVCSYTKGNNADTYEITLDQTNVNTNYTITSVTNGTLTVEKANVTKPTADDTSFTYTGQAQTYTIESSDLYTVADNTQTNAGNYTVTVSLNDTTNYQWSDGSTDDLTYTFTIAKAENEITWNDDSLNADGTLVGWAYGSKPVTHSATAKQGGGVTITYYTTYNATTGECSGEFTPSSTTSAGTYYAKAVSQDSGSNYHGTSIVMSFAVTPATLVGATVTLKEHENFVYDGTEKVVEIESVVLANGTVLTAGMYNVTGLTATNAGTHTVTVTVPNYDGSATAEFEIAKAENKITSLTITGWTYGQNANSPSIIATYTTGVVYTYSTAQDGEYTATVPTNAGTYYIKAEIPESANYLAATATTATFTISRKPIAKPAVPEGTTFTYNGEDQLEAILATVGYDSSTMTYDAGNGRISFVNAGSNKEIKFTPATNYCWDDDSTIDTISVFVSIAKAKVRVIDTVIEFDYNSNGVNWDSIAANVTATTTIVAGTKLVGTIQYTNTTDDTLTTLTTGSAIKVGSTYKIVYTVESSTNIEFVGKNYCYLKYKTAKIVGVDGYFTIEDAIANVGTGTITFIGNNSTEESYVETSFSRLPNLNDTAFENYKDAYTLSGSILYIPYDSTINTDGKTQDKTTSSKHYVYAALTIPVGITLNLTNGADIIVGAKIYYKQPNTTVVGLHGVLMNNGTINIASGCTITSYGYTKGAGIIELASGATATDCLHTYDWPGGTAASEMVNTVMPANAWNSHNISCVTKIYAGAQYKAFMYSYMSKSILEFEVAPTTIVIGNGQDSNCLFQPAENTTNAYILKYATNAAATPDDTNLTDITGSNQIVCQKDIFEFYGDYVDNAFTIQVMTGVSITTSTSIAMPTGFVDLYVKAGGTLNLSNSDYLILPGSKVVIEEGSSIVTSNGVDINLATVADIENLTTTSYCFNKYWIDKTNAYALVCGSLIIGSNCGINGEIKAGSANAFLDLSNANATSGYKIMYTNGDPVEYTGKTATGTITDGATTEITTFTAGTGAVNSIYVATSDGSDGYIWMVTPEEASTYTITTIWSTGESNTTTYRFFASSDTPTITAASLGSPSKDYYDFVGWYTDSSYETSFNTEQQVTAGGTYTYYANLDEIEYNVTYILYSDELGVTELDTSTLDGYANSSSTSYSATQSLVLYQASCGEMVFDGWYIYNPTTGEYIDLTESVSSWPVRIGTAGTTIGGMTLGDDLTDFELVGTLKNLQKFTVTYKAQTTADSDTWETVGIDTDVVEGTVIDYASILSELFDNNNDYNYNSSYKHYFDTSQWYTDQACTTKFEPPADGIASNLILYAKRSNKDSVTVTYTYSSKNSSGANVTSSATYYRNPGGGTATVPLGNPSTHGGVNTYYTDASDGTYKSVWTYDYWTYGSSTATKSADISANTTFTAHYTETKYWKVTLIASGTGLSGAAKLTYSYTGFDADGNFGTYSNKTVTGGFWTTTNVIIYANVKPEVTVNVGSKTESGALTSGTLTIKVTA